MNRLLLLAVFTVLLQLSEKSYAQAPNWLWIKSIGSTGNDVSHDMATDSAGNIYVTGSYEFTVDFDPGAGVSNLTCAGILDAFLLKLDPAGNFLWAISLGDAGSDVGYSVDTDHLGNVYVTGRYYGTVDFDPGAGVTSLTSNGNFDAFIVKFTDAGAFVWAKSVGGSGDDQTFSIAIDNAGSIVVCGYFQGSADFDPSAANYTLTSNGNYDAFVLKLENAGGFHWAHNFGGVLFDAAIAVTSDGADRVIVTGHYNGSMIDFDPGAGTAYLTQAGGDDNFITKLDAGGNFVWAAMNGGNQTDWSIGIQADDDGSVYTSGRFRGVADFDPGAPLTQLNANSNSYSDAYTAKLNSSGGYAWAHSIGGTIDDETSDVSLDTDGNVYVGGFFSFGVDMDPGPGTNIMTALGVNDAFITKTDSTGNYKWTKRFGGMASDLCYSLANDPTNRVVATGTFMSWFVYADADTLNNACACSTTADIFIGKLDTAFISGVATINQAEFSVFPNPARDVVYVTMDHTEDVTGIEIVDITGSLVYSESEISSRKFTINTKGIANGIYFIRVFAGNDSQYRKLIISR